MREATRAAGGDGLQDGCPQQPHPRQVQIDDDSWQRCGITIPEFDLGVIS